MQKTFKKSKKIRCVRKQYLIYIKKTHFFRIKSPKMFFRVENRRTFAPEKG